MTSNQTALEKRNLRTATYFASLLVGALSLLGSVGCGGGSSNSQPPPPKNPPTIAKSYAGASVALNGTTTLTFNVSNPNSSLALSGIDFADALPSGQNVASPNGLSGNCGEGTITALAGSSSVSLSGASLAATASCRFAINVTGTASGTQKNTTSAVTSNEA